MLFLAQILMWYIYDNKIWFLKYSNWFVVQYINNICIQKLKLEINIIGINIMGEISKTKYNDEKKNM